MGNATRLQYSQLYTFDGGVDEYHDHIMLAKNKLRYAKDIFLDGGKLFYRPGRDLSTPTFTHKVDGFHEYIDENGDAHLLVSVNGDILEITTGSAVTIISGLTQEYMHFMTYRGKCWINGPTTQRKITVTTDSIVGVEAPASAPTAVAAAGSLTGSYAWKCTYVIETGGVREFESNPSAVSNTLVLSSQGATITPPASSDSRVNARYIYRTTDSGARYYYEGKISNNTPGQTFASGSVTDAEIVYNGEAETNHGVPEDGSICEGAGYRLFWIDGEYIRYSEIANTDAYLEYQNSTNYIKLPQKGLGTGLKRVYNYNTGKDDLYIFQEGAVSVLIGSDPNTPIYSISTNVGCSQHDTIAVYNSSVVFLSNLNTICQISEGRVIDISKRSIPTSMALAVDSSVSRANIIFDHYYALCMRDDATKLYNNKVWVCDLRKVREVEAGYANAVWFPWHIDCEYVLQRNNGTVLCIDNNAKKIFILDKDLHRDDLADGSGTSNIEPEWWCGSFGGDSPLIEKRANVITLLGKQSQDLIVNAFAVNKGAGFSTLTNYGNIFIVGTSTMGSALTDDPDIVPAAIPRDCCGHFLSFKFKKEAYDILFYAIGYQFTYQMFDRFRR